MEMGQVGNLIGDNAMTNSLISMEVVNFKEELKRIEKEALEIAEAEISEKVEFATSQLRVVTPVDTGEARSGWVSAKTLGGHVIENEVEHIVYLNNGHSKQAPRYFIEQVLTTIGVLTP